MLTWFREIAPIRTKFKVLTGIQASLAFLVTLATLLMIEDILSGHMMTLLIAAMSASTVAVIVVAGRMICDPYVATVVRMEDLAAGDLESPVKYTNYQDCVGRLTRAMATFRQQAIDINESRQAQDRVVAVMADCLQRLAANDMTARMTDDLPDGYEALQNNFNRAAAALDKALNDVAMAATDILDGSSEIRSASDDLSVRTEQQAAALEESSTSITEITGTVAKNAAAAQSAAHSVREVQTEARHGGDVVKQAVEAMTAIQSSADEIAQIISVIDGIAFQTNLLALNAGVEAARAGESGKGFAVVANEVRALAQRSAEASTQIRTLISASTQQVSDGVTLVGATGAALEAIVRRIDEISDSVYAIAETAARQSTSLDHVSSAANDMSRMTQQNAAMVEQSNAAARQLAEQANQLSQLVAGFRISGDSVVLPFNGAAGPRSVARKAATSAVPGGRLAPVSSAALAEDDWAQF